MMTLAAFNSSVKQVRSILTDSNLLKASGVKVINRDDVSQEFKTASQKGDYYNLYKCAVDNFDYDFLLIDDSILQFSFEVNKSVIPAARYAFFQNPQEYKSYEQYLELLRAKNIIEEETNEEIGDSFIEDYQQFLTEQSLNTSSTCLRYDLDDPNYDPLIHAASHLHIGHRNNIRIPCDKILTPLKFTVFVLKHVYYYQWKELVANENESLLTCLNIVKSQCSPLLDSHWKNIEEKELFLS